MTQPLPTQLPITFAYRAQDHEGDAMTGTLDALNIDDASQRLRRMGLRVMSIAPASFEPAGAVPLAGRALGMADFNAFNDQLAHLATAGLPVEHGLKLIAQDLHGGRLADTVRAIADALDRGTSLADALAAHRRQFPPLYAELVEAGVRSHNLGGMLMNLSTHMEMVRRLRAAIWQAVSYPLMVFVGLLIVMLFLSVVVFPQFRQMYTTGHGGTINASWGIHSTWTGQPVQPSFPAVTEMLFGIADSLRVGIPVAVVLVVFGMLFWRRRARHDAQWERLMHRVPLIGQVLRWGIVARWCDIVRLGVDAGLDLPASVQLAGDAIGSRGLQQAGEALIADLEAGRLDQPPPRNVLPPTVPAAIELAARTSNLPATLRSLSDLYRRQAESRLENVPLILTPFLLFLIAVLIGGVIAGLMLPVLQYIRWVTGN